MKRIYEPLAYDSIPDPGNYWRSTITDQWQDAPRLEESINADVVIIGAGFTGLSAALRLTTKYGADVVVLEANQPGWGASGRNGGFACIGGSMHSNHALISRYGLDAAKIFADAQMASVDLVAQLLAENDIDADRHSDGEIALAHRPKDFDAFDEEVETARQLFGDKFAIFSREELAEIGIKGPQFHGGLREKLGFAINPLKYILGLAKAAASNGARLYGDSAVQSIEWADGRHVLTATAGEVRAKKLIVATNGYSSDDLPRWLNARYLPVVSNIIVTRPMTDRELADQGWTSDLMAYDTRNLLHYFRLMPNRRFLFGMRGGTSISARSVDGMRKRIRKHFEKMFPAWRDVETPYFWHGLACVARDRNMYIGPIGEMENAWTALAYHGNGVSMGTWSGARLADLVCGEIKPADLPEIVRGPMKTFPLSSSRRVLLAPAYAGFYLRDEWI